MKTRSLLLIYGSFLVELIFNLVPSGGNYHFFPFFHGYGDWDGSMSWQNYIHKFCEFPADMMIVGAFWNEQRSPELGVIFWLIFCDLIDFVLCYNYRWFWLSLPNGYRHSVEFNDIMFVLIAILIIQTVWQKHQSRLS